MPIYFRKTAVFFKKMAVFRVKSPGIVASVRVFFVFLKLEFIYSIFLYLFWEGSCIYNKKNQVVKNYLIFSGAEDGAQTRDPQLGRLMLYQLSYFRNFSGQRWIRTTEGVSQQIYSLPHLATLVFAHSLLITHLSSFVE